MFGNGQQQLPKKDGSWFKGAKNKFSPRVKRTTASTIAAVGALDFDVQSVIFGTLKALLDEMGFGLSHGEQIARGCPSVKTLHNWEFKLATSCMATVIHQIAKDAKQMTRRYNRKLDIALVTDHGNREGVDHLKDDCMVVMG